MLLSVVSWAPSLAKLNSSNISHVANFENFLQFPHRIIIANFQRSYLPQYSSSLCNLGLHEYLLEKTFPTVYRLHEFDTQVESHDHFNLLPLKNPRIIVQLRELLCLACNGVCGTHVGCPRHVWTLSLLAYLILFPYLAHFLSL